ncbi:MAG: glycine cleavage system protein GcvH [Fimbriimonadaceae bacterium]
MSSIPEDLSYTPTHEWVRLEGDVATIGVTDFAQSELGDVVYVELPEPGRIVAVGDTFGSVESVKTVSDLYAPVGGEVIEVNAVLKAQSELVNSDPYGAGYLLKVRVSAPPQNLLSAAAYAPLAG